MTVKVKWAAILKVIKKKDFVPDSQRNKAHDIKH